MKNFTINGAWYHIDAPHITIGMVEGIRSALAPLKARVQYPNGLTMQLTKNPLPLVDGLRITLERN